MTPTTTRTIRERVASDAVAAADPALIEARGIGKRYGAVRALDDVTVAIRRGEILGLLGENGAGKTTLMNVLGGMTAPDAGAVLIEGRPVRIGTPRDALRLGIGTVYQHFALVPTLTVLENARLGVGGPLARTPGAVERRLAEVGRQLGMDVPPGAVVGHLSLGQRQRVEIARALVRGARVLLLDEPTSALSPPEVDGLMATLRELRARGVAVVLITHKLGEALRLCDRVVVLRQGRVAGDLDADILDGDSTVAERRVVDLMFGGSGVAAPPPTSGVPADARAALAVRGLVVRGDGGDAAIRGLDLAVRAGEVFGIAGVDGNGQTELADAIAGQRAPSVGTIAVDGVEIAGRGVGAAATAGVGYVTGDRIGEGSVAAASVAENLALKEVGSGGEGSRFWLDRRGMERRARAAIERFAIRAPGPATPIGRLSGGNVQKVLLARELARVPPLLVCHQPTHGLDARTARDVLTALRAHADGGRAVLVISSELDDLLAIADRIGVLVDGRLAATVARVDADADAIGRLMVGGHVSAPDRRPA